MAKLDFFCYCETEHKQHSVLMSFCTAIVKMLLKKKRKSRKLCLGLAVSTEYYAVVLMWDSQVRFWIMSHPNPSLLSCQLKDVEEIERRNSPKHTFRYDFKEECKNEGATETIQANNHQISLFTFTWFSKLINITTIHSESCLTIRILEEKMATVKPVQIKLMRIIPQAISLLSYHLFLSSQICMCSL